MVLISMSLPAPLPQTICDWMLYCHKAKLIVELDGSQHCTPEEIQYDKKSQFLQSQGLTVLPFSNLNVMRQFEAVCEVIDRTIKQDQGGSKSEIWY